MFASIVHGVVVKVLTKYFDGIDESEINVRLWKGEIELFHLKVILRNYKVLLTFGSWRSKW